MTYDLAYGPWPTTLWPVAYGIWSMAWPMAHGLGSWTYVGHIQVAYLHDPWPMTYGIWLHDLWYMAHSLWLSMTPGPRPMVYDL
jgi:hypothetical protein